MTFQTYVQVNGKHYATDTLIDTGATHCFVIKQFVESNGWQTEFEEGQVTCAGDSVIQIQGLLKAKLQIQGFSSILDLPVMDLPSQGNTKIILGQSWLSNFKANIDFKNQCITYEQHGKGEKYIARGLRLLKAKMCSPQLA